MANDTSAIDAVIVAFRSEDVIERTLQAIRPLGGQMVVVDHHDGQAGRRAAELGARVVHDPTNPGFGAGQNRGVAMTTSPLVLLCNPDAVIDSEAVRRGGALLAARPGVAAAQGVIVNEVTREPERSQGLEVRPIHLVGRAVAARRLLAFSVIRTLLARSSVLGDHAKRIPPRPTDVESLAATAVLVRRAAFEQVDGFDPSYFLYGEDLDLCRRLRRAGWTLVALPEVWATHQNGGSSASAWDRELQWWHGTMGFAARWWGPGAWSLAMVATLVRSARLALRHPCRSRAVARAMVIQPARDRRRARGAEFGRGLNSTEQTGGVAPERIPSLRADPGNSGDHVSRVSVIVRCHQQGRFLAEAVGSARGQTRQPDEIVVVNDGSTDETTTVLALLASEGPLVLVDHERPQGPAKSFNAGVEASSGDLILALDADDTLSSNYVELTEQAILDGVDLAYGGVERFGAESSSVPPHPFEIDELGVESFLHVSTMFRRSIFERTGGFRPDLDDLGLEDWEFWVSAIELGAVGRAVHGCWLRYRRHPEGSRNTVRRAQVLRVHLRVRRLHPGVVTWRHLGRWVARSLRRNLPFPCTALVW